VRYLHLCAHEQFPPDQLLHQAIAAEAAGFDGIGCSDHLQPWWEGGEAGSAWPWLGAAAQATERVLFGTAVTPPGPRYHPALIAQAWATFELMFPGRPYLGVGSGEALNEFPVSGEWPSVGDQIERMEEALEMIRALWDGQRLTDAGKHFRRDGKKTAILDKARETKGSQPDEFYKENWHDPKAMYEEGERQVSDQEFKEEVIIAADPEVHVERIREVEGMGPTIVALMNNSGADPLAAIEAYRDKVLPRLAGSA